MSKWYLNENKNSDIVFSSRIRIARNLKGFPFPNKMNDEQKYSVIQKVSDAVFKSELKDEFTFIDIDKISEVEAYSLVERHLISPEFASNTKGRALILKNDESLSIMINEEDHLRIQALCSGLELEKAFEDARKIEKIISENNEFSFDEQFGFLTECPTNLGTGLRASVMMHLPALEKLGVLDRIFNNISKMGVAIRGTFGEGSKPKSSMYQISNQVTLGISENKAIETINSITNQLIDKEKEARNAFDRSCLEDDVFRALGTLKFARKMSTEEMFKLISDVRIGVSMGIVDVPVSVMNKILLETGKAGICLDEKETLESDIRDSKRANYIRDRLSQYN